MIVTSGPTHEPIDPVRYIANRSSGKQGHAIAKAAAEAGARVTLISGPVTLPDPSGVTIVHVESAREMLEAVEKALPADIGIFAAAVADWRVANAGEQKIKKKDGALAEPVADGKPRHSRHHLASLGQPPAAHGGLCGGDRERDRACEAEAREEGLRPHRRQRRLDRNGGVMGGDSNTVHLVTASDVETWPTLSKTDVAKKLVERLGAMVGGERP